MFRAVVHGEILRYGNAVILQSEVRRLVVLVIGPTQGH